MIQSLLNIWHSNWQTFSYRIFEWCKKLSMIQEVVNLFHKMPWIRKICHSELLHLANWPMEFGEICCRKLCPTSPITLTQTCLARRRSDVKTCVNRSFCSRSDNSCAWRTPFSDRLVSRWPSYIHFDTITHSACMTTNWLSSDKYVS